jgi:cyclophilin family peptidyl-prolyl cis-trans isomerase
MTARSRVLVIALLGALALAACGSSSKSSAGSSSDETTAPASSSPSAASKSVKLTGFVADPNKLYTATIDTNYGPIVVALDSKQAPKASGRFIELARAGFYNGLTWHRVVADFVIQSGDPNGDGSGDSGNPPITDFTGKNNYPLGSVAAAKKATDPDGTFDSQFFIVTGSGGGSLPNQYALFGNVTSGIDNAKKIMALAPPEGDGPPTSEAIIKTVTITES